MDSNPTGGKICLFVFNILLLKCCCSLILSKCNRFYRSQTHTTTRERKERYALRGRQVISDILKLHLHKPQHKNGNTFLNHEKELTAQFGASNIIQGTPWEYQLGDHKCHIKHCHFIFSKINFYGWAYIRVLLVYQNFVYRVFVY